MKKVKVKYLYLADKPTSDGIMFDDINDLKILRGELKLSEFNVLKKFIKSGEAPHRLNHIVRGFQSLEMSIASLAMTESFVDESNPLYKLGNASDVFINQVAEAIIKDGKIFMNKNGGLTPIKDIYGNDSFEIISEEEIFNLDSLKRKRYFINRNTKYIVLENDFEVEMDAHKYLKSVDCNYSHVTDLLLLDRSDLKKIFLEFIDNGGEIVYVYTTGMNQEQMYEYSSAAIDAGIKKFEFYFNSGMDNKINSFINWLRGKHGISVKILS